MTRRKPAVIALAILAAIYLAALAGSLAWPPEPPPSSARWVEADDGSDDSWLQWKLDEDPEWLERRP